LTQLSLEDRRRRLAFRGDHRGTKEADMLIGGFVRANVGTWGEAEIAWAEALLHEQDADVMAWAIGTTACPSAYEGPLMAEMRRLDYIAVAR
jgi:antitoxin CptB